MRKGINFLMSLFVALSLFALPIVSAYDSSNPYTVDVNWIVPEDTTFTVALAGQETTVDFEPVNKSQSEVDASSQNSTVPIVTVTNQGNVVANYSTVLVDVYPTWVTMKGNNADDYATASEVDNSTAYTFAEDIGSGTSSELWLWSDFTDAPKGTATSTLQINSI